MFLPDWLKRTVALLWYRTYKGGVVSVLLGVSLHHRALTFSLFPLPSWVLDLRCLFLSAGGVRSVLRRSTSPLSLLLPYSSCRFSSFGSGVSCGSVLRHSTTLTLSLSFYSHSCDGICVKAQHLFHPFILWFASCFFVLCVKTQRCLWKYEFCLVTL